MPAEQKYSGRETSPQAQQGQNAQKQKIPEKSSPFSLPIVLIAVGGALVVMPWFSAGNFLMKLILAVVGAGLAYLGFILSK